MKAIDKLRHTLTNLESNDYSEYNADQLVNFIKIHSREMLLTLKDLEREKKCCNRVGNWVTSDMLE